ncbi:porphobilinogen deaminase [Saitoella coloradoensis]
MSGSAEKTSFPIGSRRSKLALVQTELVQSSLQALHPDLSFPISAMQTMGDKNQIQSLYNMGKSLWTKELEVVLFEGDVDLIVHSLKDMPTTLPEGARLGAILEREDPRDALVMRAGSTYKILDDLPEGAIVGTSSVRRTAQLKRKYPHLQFADVRGNVLTRLEKLDGTFSVPPPSSSSESPIVVPEYSCLILAAAGLIRLGLGGRITGYLEAPTLLHAVGQGALGIEIRENDEKTAQLLAPLIHRPTWLRCVAERALMRTLEGGCSVPIGVQTSLSPQNLLEMHACVVSIEGTEYVEAKETMVVSSDEEAEELGKLVAMRLIEGGAGTVLERINEVRERHQD